MAIDIFCGLGGWTEGLLAEGYDVIGFDIERHRYWMPDETTEAEDGDKGTNPIAKRGWTQGCAVSLGMEGAGARPRTKLVEYPAQLVLQDVRTLHGKQFRDAALIVASPPCQEYSYMAMPWSRAKAIAAEYRNGTRDRAKLTELFDACFRIQREAIAAAGHYIPLVVENVRGACSWVGRSRWNYGSFHLWGDVPALMPMTRSVKVPMPSWSGYGKADYVAQAFNGTAERQLAAIKVPGFRFDGSGKSFQSASVEVTKNNGGSWFNIGSPGQKVTNQNPVHEGVKFGGEWFNDSQPSIPRRYGSSKSPARKAASAAIAKIPLPLARHIARTWLPSDEHRARPEAGT